MGAGTSTPTTGSRRRGDQARCASPSPGGRSKDDVDAAARADLDAWRIATRGSDGPRRFAVTAEEAAGEPGTLPAAPPAALRSQRGRDDGRGRLDGALAAVGAAEPGSARPAGGGARAAVADAPLAAREGFVRQILGWRDYIWHLYWYLGAEYREHNALAARALRRPEWFDALDPAVSRSGVPVATSCGKVHDYGWAHHIERLMVLGSWALQRGYEPAELSDWFRDAFVDGFAWVMDPNVIGMSQYADGGIVATKPYTSGGAYLKRMSNHCGDCAFRPMTAPDPGPARSPPATGPSCTATTRYSGTTTACATRWRRCGGSPTSTRWWRRPPPTPADASAPASGGQDLRLLGGELLVAQHALLVQSRAPRTRRRRARWMRSVLC